MNKKLDEASILSEGLSSAEFTGYLDTGSYTLNAALSGSIYGGMPDNKVLCVAGASTTGKSYFSLAIVKNFLGSNPEGGLVLFDTEAAHNTNLYRDDIGIDPSLVLNYEPETVQDFSFQAMKFLVEYEKDQTKPKVMFLLDSLGRLTTSKSLNDMVAGKDVLDMTRAKTIHTAFRGLRLKLAKNKIPMIVTNHVYADVNARFPSNKVAGGGGVIYSSDMIILLSKEKVQEEIEGEKRVLGNIIHVKVSKSRHSRENMEVETMINYSTGMNRYWGLLDMAEKAGVLEKGPKQWVMPDGTKVYEKTINNDPEKYFTKDILDRIETYVNAEYRYGLPSVEEAIEEVKKEAADFEN